MTTLPDLPHDPYIAAVHAALTAAGITPDDCWTSGADTNPYDPDSTATMLSAVITWNAPDIDAPDIDDPSRDGLMLLWEHPAEQWQYAAVRTDGSNTGPEFLPNLGLYADPDAVAQAARALLTADAAAVDGAR